MQELKLENQEINRVKEAWEEWTKVRFNIVIDSLEQSDN
jgi:hypothetical protein